MEKNYFTSGKDLFINNMHPIRSNPGISDEVGPYEKILPCLELNFILLH